MNHHLRPMTQESDNVRLEAFCDGVFAIALTLLIIDIKIPATADIHDAAGLWRALAHIAPSMFAFLLSFCVVLVTWVNHHGQMKLVNGATGMYVYANGFLLLTVVFTPFPTSLIGEYLLTDHAAPAVVLYNAVLALQAVAWITLSRTALRGGLARNERAKAQLRENGRLRVMAFGLYGLCSVVALWIPLGIAIFTTLTWFFWLVQGARMKQQAVDGRN